MKTALPPLATRSQPPRDLLEPRAIASSTILSILKPMKSRYDSSTSNIDILSHDDTTLTMVSMGSFPSSKHGRCRDDNIDRLIQRRLAEADVRIRRKVEEKRRELEVQEDSIGLGVGSAVVDSRPPRPPEIISMPPSILQVRNFHRHRHCDDFEYEFKTDIESESPDSPSDCGSGRNRPHMIAGAYKPGGVGDIFRTALYSEVELSSLDSSSLSNGSEHDNGGEKVEAERSPCYQIEDTITAGGSIALPHRN